MSNNSIVLWRIHNGVYDNTTVLKLFIVLYLSKTQKSPRIGRRTEKSVQVTRTRKMQLLSGLILTLTLRLKKKCNWRMKQLEGQRYQCYWVNCVSSQAESSQSLFLGWFSEKESFTSILEVSQLTLFSMLS